MQKLRDPALIFIVAAFGAALVGPGSGQTVSTPTVTCDGTTLIVTSSINPVSSIFSFQWIVRNGTEDVSLSSYGLDNSGGIVLIGSNQDDYVGTYSISNNPSNLDPINAPFNSTLSSPNAALVPAVCNSQSGINSFTIGIAYSSTDATVSISCSMNCGDDTTTNTTTTLAQTINGSPSKHFQYGLLCLMIAILLLYFSII